MLRVRATAAAVMGLCLSAFGCGSAPAEEGEAILATEQGIIVMNGLDPAFFWQPSTQQALRALAAAPLAEAIDGAAGAELLSSAEGEALLARVVACALPDRSTLDSVQASYRGVLGLAPRWASAPLSSVAQRRWLTACLLQSLNGLGAHVAIHLTGGHPALLDDPDGQASGYTVRDAIMFGDLFSSEPPKAFACADNMPAEGCGVSWSDETLVRLCGQSPTCGLTILGHCGAVCTRDGAGALTCDAPGGQVYPEAVASRLSPSVAASVGLICDPPAAALTLP